MDELGTEKRFNANGITQSAEAKKKLVKTIRAAIEADKLERL